MCFILMFQVLKCDVIEFEWKLEGEFFNKWYESCEVMKIIMVLIENINGFLDYMNELYEGN